SETWTTARSISGADAATGGRAVRAEAARAWVAPPVRGLGAVLDGAVIGAEERLAAVGEEADHRPVRGPTAQVGAADLAQRRALAHHEEAILVEPGAGLQADHPGAVGRDRDRLGKGFAGPRRRGSAGLDDGDATPVEVADEAAAAGEERDQVV